MTQGALEGSLEPRTICIAVPTTGTRPEALSACLAGIGALRLPAGVSVHVAIIRNGEPGEEDLESEAHRAGIASASVVLERRLGIPFARNAALQFSFDGGFDYLAFIDDDAAPDPDWLERLYSPLQGKGADAATGPQVPIFPPNTSAELSKAEIFRERRLADGSRCAWAATNNVIFSVPFVKKHALWFESEFATGGEDKQFFLRFTKLGGKIVWVADAVVREPVVSGRLSRKWAVRRAYRYGSTGFSIERSIRSPVSAVAVCIVKGGGHIASGLVKMPLALLPGSAALIDSACSIAHGAGFLLGMAERFRSRRYA